MSGAWNSHGAGKRRSMEILAVLRNGDHRLTKRMAAWDSAWPAGCCRR